VADVFNPYTAPATSSNGIDGRVGSEADGVWRDGEMLVMRRLSRLPNICVKTGKTSDIIGITRKLYWIPDWTWLTLFVGGPGLTAVFALIFGRRQAVDIPINAQEHSKRRFRVYVGFFLVFLGPAITTLYFFISFGFKHSATTLNVLIVCGLVSIVGIVVAAISESFVAPNGIDREFIWLRGIHRDLLESLPAFPADMSPPKRRFALGDFFDRDKRETEGSTEWFARHQLAPKTLS